MKTIFERYFCNNNINTSNKFYIRNSYEILNISPRFF